MGSRGATTVHRDTRSAGNTCYPAMYLDASSVPCAPHPAAVGGDVLGRKRRSIGSAYVFHPKRRANKVVPATTSLICLFFLDRGDERHQDMPSVFTTGKTCLLIGDSLSCSDIRQPVQHRHRTLRVSKCPLSH